ncbi:MAG: roadblock/LC7 domain-containing protein [Desulfuromonadaceae bacterium]|nr:roadblock/LC7 domain-containing protein [Desulfuromonadaceae bacterium]
MKEILQHINSVEGVMGSALFSPKGEVLAHAFSALIDAVSLKKAALLTLKCTHGLQISQTLELLDLRYTDGHILVKAFPGGMLFLLCTNGINLQVLSITLNLAVKKFEAMLLDEAHVANQPLPVESSGSGDGLLRMNVSRLANKETSASFDALGMVAVSQPTSQFISNYYNTPFKKLILTNATAGTSGTFPVMILKEMDQQYDGSVVIGPGIERKLKVSQGDKVEVKIG